MPTQIPDRHKLEKALLVITDNKAIRQHFFPVLLEAAEEEMEENEIMCLLLFAMVNLITNTVGLDIGMRIDPKLLVPSIIDALCDENKKAAENLKECFMNAIETVNGAEKIS